MDGTGPQHPLSDSQLDRELESALGVEPSPEFLARVRTRIAAEPRVSAWRLAVWSRGLQPAVAMAAAAVLLAVVIPGVMRTMKRATPDARVAREAVRPDGHGVAAVPIASREDRSSAGGTDVPAVAEATVDKHVGFTSDAHLVHELPLQLSPVLFAEHDRVAFASLVTAVADGTVAENVLTARAEEALVPLAIPPLVIDPLPPLARLNNEGEGQW